MAKIEDKTEELLARVMGVLAERFKNQLILKGGILLRLLNSPRRTQDLDYCWIQTKKRELLAQELRKAIETMDGVRVTDVQVNSRGVFITLRDEVAETLAKIEVSVIEATHMPPQPMSTSALTNRYALKTRVISVMDLSEAMSHKIAAAIERNLIRDLYDLNQLEPLTKLDPGTLKARLANLEVGRTKVRTVGLEEAADLLQKKLEQITQKNIVAELGGALPEDTLPGLDLVVRATVLRITEQIRNMTSRKRST